MFQLEKIRMKMIKLKLYDTSDQHVSHFHASYLFWPKKSDWNIKYLGHGKIFESFFVLWDFVFSLKQLFASFEQNNFEKQNFIKLSLFCQGKLIPELFRPQ